MEKESYSSNSELLSHPNRSLESHTNSVVTLALRNFETIPLLYFSFIEKDILKQIIRIVATCHDLGKATSYFQNYITTQDENEKVKLKSKESTHALLGAVAAFLLTKDYIKKSGVYDVINRFLPILAFIVCRRHHGNLKHLFNDLILNEEDVSLLKKQIQSIDRHKFQILLNKINCTLDLEWLLREVERLEEISFEMQDEIDEILSKKESLDFYFLVHIVYSLLLDADKTEAVSSKKDREKISILRSNYHITHEIVDQYKEKKNWESNQINRLRQEAYDEILSTEIDIDTKIYSINLPTGLGKTLASLSFALKLRDLVTKKKSRTARIIYTLPFLSIIDQNSKIIEEILKEGGIKPLNNILLKHHHLVDITQEWKEGEEDFDLDAANVLLEGWDSEIIVTTFIQLFETLVSNKNRSVRKFHRITGSIVILDEVQTIPHKYWHLMREVITYMCERFDTYFIFVTATEPLIFKREEVIPLVNSNRYFKELNRVTLKPYNIEEPITIHDLANLVGDKVVQTSSSFLFIFNTINSAKEFYYLIKKSNMIDPSTVTFLSTHIVPKERLRRIEAIKKGEIRIAVTTQLVEAGVDIDFKYVYRDFAPLDAINQSAGRCNRNGEVNGEIIIVNLWDEKRSLSSYIYDSMLLDITRQILKGKDSINESEFLQLIDHYYHMVSERMSKDPSREVLNALYKLDYDGERGVSSFKLIKEDWEKIDIFIELDGEAISHWESFSKIKNIKNFHKRRKEFLRIKPKFYSYVVAVPYRKDINLPDKSLGFPYVANAQLKDYYDLETGYKTTDGIAFW